MANDPTPPTPAPAPGDNTPGKSPLELNAAQAAAVKKAEDVCKRALMTEYLPTFIAQGEVQADIVALQGKCKEARDFASEAMQKTTEKHGEVKVEQSAEEKLIQVIQFFQKKARRKYARSATPEVLKDYFVGERLDNNRDNLLQYASAIALKIKTDVLPGVGAAEKTMLDDAIKAFTDPDADAVQGEATGLRKQLVDLLKEIMDGRMNLQFTADAAWPHDDPLNAGVRVLFYLPANRPFATPV